MNLNDEKGTDPTVEAIVEMFPEDFLRNTARESGLVIRGRRMHLTSFRVRFQKSVLLHPTFSNSTFLILFSVTVSFPKKGFVRPKQ